MQEIVTDNKTVWSSLHHKENFKSFRLVWKELCEFEHTNSHFENSHFSSAYVRRLPARSCFRVHCNRAALFRHLEFRTRLKFLKWTQIDRILSLYWYKTVITHTTRMFWGTLRAAVRNLSRMRVVPACGCPNVVLSLSDVPILLLLLSIQFSWFSRSL